MNEHLKPVFTKILPELEISGIKYFTYGGAAVAGLEGEWIRYNDDIDIGVMDKDFDRTVKLLHERASTNNWKIRYSLLKNGRPKLDIYPDANKKEQFSVVPLYKTTKGIEFRFVHPITLPVEVLNTIRVKIEDYPFDILKREYIQSLLIHYLKSNKGTLKVDDKKYKDAIRLLPIDLVNSFYQVTSKS